MCVRNIRELKKNLRAQYRQARERMGPEQKKRSDAAILARLLALREYGRAPVVFTYVSKPSEVDTTALIEAALAAHKKVAVPLCFPEAVEMRFYEIGSVGELRKGLYGVLEPDPEKSRPAEAAEDSICIVPGLSFDSQGYRLGYGKGYYDRFLSGFPGVTVGLCYSGCVKWDLPHGYYDRPVDLLITEKYLRRISGRHSDGGEGERR